jgi:hypothetical protein
MKECDWEIIEGNEGFVEDRLWLQWHCHTCMKEEWFPSYDEPPRVCYEKSYGESDE